MKGSYAWDVQEQEGISGGQISSGHGSKKDAAWAW